MVRTLFLSILLLLLLTSCAIYKPLPMETYEKKEPYGHIEFLMKDRSVKSVDAADMVLVKSTPDLYIIYLKEGGIREIRKDQVESVRMADRSKIKSFGTGLLIGSSVLTLLLIIILATQL